MIHIDPKIILDAQHAALDTGFPFASVTIAQYGIESEWGRKMIPHSFNPFGIKELPGRPFVEILTHEFQDGKMVEVKARFAVFEDLYEAFAIHDRLLMTGNPYARARSCFPNALAFSKEMAKVYATDPNYGNLLCEIIKDHDLTRYDIFKEKQPVSDLAKFVRALPGGGPVLNAIEGEERLLFGGSAPTAPGASPTEPSVAASVTPPTPAAAAAQAAAPVATVAVKDFATVVQATVHALLSRALGPAAAIPEDVATFALTELENWVLSKL